uniref:U1 small nuclear ribonucleoprotein C n=1 Tax=Sinocyclocheilus anshuiensis TaxID=1608454 RepID=A0A671SG17_9TELE
MPKFYCDYCDTYLTHDSPSVRKTHCSGRKHKENVKDYYQKWMEEQAQNLIDKTTAAFQQGKIPPTPFPGAPPPGGSLLPHPNIKDDSRFVMPGADPCWSLRKYINFALWIARSAFTVDEAESSPGSSHVVSTSPPAAPFSSRPPLTLARHV